MKSNSANAVVCYLRRIARADHLVARSDGQLLESFIEENDHGAFAVLVHRHAPMVFGVCRRILAHTQDADDAFQATLLVLVRKARSIVPRERVAPWLYGVACRTARKARAVAARRRRREKQLITLPEGQAPLRPQIYQELIPLLDQELSRLPEIYRIPIILCDLQERPIAQTARQLGWPQGTLAGRLARGRAMLAKRLTRHGFGLCAVSPAALLTTDSPAMPQALAAHAIRAASHWTVHGMETGIVSTRVASLAKGVLESMLVSKLVPVAAVIIGIVLSATGLFGYKIAARESDPPVPVVGKTQDPVESKPEKPKPPVVSAKEPEKRKPGAEEAPANDRLEVVLREWAKADHEIRDLHCKLRRIKDDRVYGTKETADGEAWIKKPDLWRVELKPVGKGLASTIILTEKEIVLREGSKEARFSRLPPTDNQQSLKFWGFNITFDFSYLSRMLPFGIPVSDIRSYYTVRLTGEDRFYSYIELLPKSNKDRAWFTSMKLAFTRKTHLLRLVTYGEPNGNQTHWDILDLQTNVNPPITRDFILKGLHLDGRDKE